jgi:hypothetical protein
LRLPLSSGSYPSSSNLTKADNPKSAILISPKGVPFPL